ncbi:L-threonine 3-dehydrogenase [subsurface metagenome]
MQKAVIFGDQKAGIVEVPDPQPKEDWVVVKVHATAMCTEYKTFVAGGKMDIIGHEGAGEVVAVAQPGSVEVGDRVVVLPLNACGKCSLCRAGDGIYCENNLDFEHAYEPIEEFMGTREGSGTFAQYVVKPPWLLSKIPDGVSYERATMVIDGIGTPFGAIADFAVLTSLVWNQCRGVETVRSRWGRRRCSVRTTSIFSPRSGHLPVDEVLTARWTSRVYRMTYGAQFRENGSVLTPHAREAKSHLWVNVQRT